MWGIFEKLVKCLYVSDIHRQRHQTSPKRRLIQFQDKLRPIETKLVSINQYIYYVISNDNNVVNW